LQNVVFDPIAQIMMKVEQRVADLEATVAAFAGSFTSERIIAQQLCVADGSGTRTCITKEQLDALLQGAMQAGQKSASIEVGTPTQAAASTEESVSSVSVAAAPSDTPLANEAPAAAAADSDVPPAVAATVMAPATEKPASGVDESTMPMAEVAASTPSATPPSAEQPAASAGESGVPLAAITTATPQTTEPVEAVVAATAKPQTVIAAGQPAKDEELASTAPATANSPAPALNAAPAEAAPAADRVE
jgi:hypothetical protein